MRYDNEKLRINNVKRQDRDAGEVETIDGKKYSMLNVLIDSGADGSILDKETAECYELVMEY